MKLKFTIEEARTYIGRKFDHLTIDDIEISPTGKKIAVCSCCCGKTSKPTLAKVIRGHSASCGCKRATSNQVKGFGNHPLLSIWRGMKMRTIGRSREKNPKLVCYVAKGIRLYEEWKSFLVFKEWAEKNGFRPGLEIDRKDNNGHYEPNNCRFVDRVTQANNKSNNIWVKAFGETKTVAQWSRDSRCVVKFNTLWKRVRARLDRNELTESEAEACLTIRLFKTGPKPKK